MIEMSDYVLDLLFRQKVISIPGLGTFRIVSSNSSIDFATNTLNPPNYEIRFDEGVQEDNAVSLLDFLIQEKKFTPDDAKIKLDIYQNQIKQSFNNNNYVYLPEIGTISKNDAGIFYFKPSGKIASFNPTLGLPVLDVRPVSRVYSKSESNSDPVVQTSFEDHQSDYSINKRYKWLSAAILIFLISGLSLIGFFYYRNNFELSNADPLDVGSVDTNGAEHQQDALLEENGFTEATLDTIFEELPNDDIDNKSKIDPNTPMNSGDANSRIVVKSNTKAEVEDKPVIHEAVVEVKETNIESSSEYRCAVIVGSLGDANNVKKLSQRIKKLGFTPYTHKSNALTKVGALCSCDQASIDEMIVAMKKINEAAWVFQIQ